MQPQKLAILAIQSIRKKLERNFDDPQIQDENFINYIKYLLTCVGNEPMQMEAAWIFTNIAAGSSKHTKIVVQSGAVPLLIKLLSSSNRELVEQAIWGLGNIIGDNWNYRDLLLEHGILKPLLSFVSIPIKAQFQRTLVWVFVNIVRCRENPLPLEIVSEIVPKLCELVQRRDIQTKIDALWALTFIADCSEDYIQKIVENDVVVHVIPMLSSNSQKVQVTAMRLLGNIAAGSDEQTQILLDNGLLNNMRFALIHHNRNLRRVALWCLSNISIGTFEQAQEIFHSGLLSVIVDNIHHVDIKIVKEAILTLRNLINAASIEQMLDIIECRAVNPMFSLILSEEPEVSEAAITSLTVLFSKSSLLVDKYAEIYYEMIK